MTQESTSGTKRIRRSGIASLFERRQLRAGFVNFLYLVGGLEVLIAAVVMIASVGIAREPFPWKAYFFIAFTVPVGLTFLVGIMMLSFDQFFFDRNADAASDVEIPAAGRKATPGPALSRLAVLLDLLGRVPVMLTLVLLLVASLALYKLDDALAFIIHTSEQMVGYLIVGIGILFAVGVLFALAWMVMTYQLRKKHMAYRENFRQAAMERLGVLIGDDQEPLDTGAATKLLPARNRPDRRERPVVLPSGERREG